MSDSDSNFNLEAQCIEAEVDAGHPDKAYQFLMDDYRASMSGDPQFSDPQWWTKMQAKLTTDGSATYLPTLNLEWGEAQAQNGSLTPKSLGEIMTSPSSSPLDVQFAKELNKELPSLQSAPEKFLGVLGFRGAEVTASDLKYQLEDPAQKFKSDMQKPLNHPIDTIKFFASRLSKLL